LLLDVRWIVVRSGQKKRIKQRNRICEAAYRFETNVLEALEKDDAGLENSWGEVEAEIWLNCAKVIRNRWTDAVAEEGVQDERVELNAEVFGRVGDCRD